MTMRQELLAQFGISDACILEDQRGLRSVPFQPHLSLAKGDQLDHFAKIIEEVTATWLTSFMRVPGSKKQQQFRDNATLILLNLVRAETEAPGQVVGISTGKQRLEQSLRYFPEFVTVSYFRQAMNVLRDTGLMYEAAQGYQINGLAQVARYALTDNGKARLCTDHLTPATFHIREATETIILKDANKNLTKYIDDGQTARMRANLNRINKVLAKANIGSTRQIDPVRDIEEGKEASGTRLYRVFNNGTFEQGGRFYGGWWEVAKRHFRPLITIDGEPTAEVDFKGLHPSILFAKRDLPIPNDPYALVPGVTDDVQLRDHAKRTFMALLNANGRHTREPRRFDSGKYGMSANEFRDTVRSAFPMFVDILGSGHGTYLQREDSDLAEKIIMHFVDQDIPILPIHDSFIVARRHTKELAQVMRHTFKVTYGKDIQVAEKVSGQ